MTESFYAGQIGYFGPEGENGRERFEIVPHAAGYTLRAFCEMDELELSRDVTMSLDADARPLDAFVRVIQRGRRLGSTLFLVDKDAIECEGITAEGGRVSQRKRLDAPLPYLGLHPLVCDGLIALSRGVDRAGEFVPVAAITNSLSPNGEQGLIAMPTLIDVAYIGPETIDVPAGSFEARRYALRWQPDWPPADLWVHGPMALFVRLEWEMIDSYYALTQLQTSR